MTVVEEVDVALEAEGAEYRSPSWVTGGYLPVDWRVLVDLLGPVCESPSAGSIPSKFPSIPLLKLSSTPPMSMIPATASGKLGSGAAPRA